MMHCFLCGHELGIIVECLKHEHIKVTKKYISIKTLKRPLQNSSEYNSSLNCVTADNQIILSGEKISVYLTLYENEYENVTNNSVQHEVYMYISF